MESSGPRVREGSAFLVMQRAVVENSDCKPEPLTLRLQLSLLGCDEGRVEPNLRDLSSARGTPMYYIVYWGL